MILYLFDCYFLLHSSSSFSFISCLIIASTVLLVETIVKVFVVVNSKLINVIVCSVVTVGAISVERVGHVGIVCINGLMVNRVLELMIVCVDTAWLMIFDNV